MLFLKLRSLHKKCGLSHAISGISFSSSKTWTNICNFWIFFVSSKNVKYLMYFPEYLTLLKKRDLSYAISEISLLSHKNVDYHMQFLEFISLLQKHGLPYAIYRISFPSLKT